MRENDSLGTKLIVYYSSQLSDTRSDISEIHFTPSVDTRMP
jgi:hypothetical protein